MKWEEVLHGDLNAKDMDALRKRYKAKRVEVFVTDDGRLAFVKDNREELENVEELIRRIIQEYLPSVSAPVTIETIDKSEELERKIDEFIRKANKQMEERFDKLERQKTEDDIEDIKKQLGWA